MQLTVSCATVGDPVCVLGVISSEVDTESTVDVMADRLCAAVHAFGLCCQAHTRNTSLP